jgi:hypothetical protein
VNGEPVALSKKEFALLRAPAADPTRVFTREDLLRSVWGFRTLGTRLLIGWKPPGTQAQRSSRGERCQSAR